jgi:acetoin utilization protein AcuB
MTATGVLQFPTLRQYMTGAVHTIAPSRSLAAAYGMMRRHRIRHLPVVEAGKVVGLLSERDVRLVDSLPNVTPMSIQVADVMVENVFTAPPDAPLGEVVETMIAKKLGAMIVIDGDRLVGVFTIVDALRALHDRLESRA